MEPASSPENDSFALQKSLRPSTTNTTFDKQASINQKKAFTASTPRDGNWFEAKLAPLIGDQAIRVAESGIHTPDDVARMATVGFDAVLVGESLIRSDDPVELLTRFVAAGL